MAGSPTVVSPKEMFKLIRHGPECLILAFKRQRGEENHKFEASLGYVAGAFLIHKQPSKQTKNPPTGGVARWKSACLAHTMPWAQSLA